MINKVNVTDISRTLQSVLVFCYSSPNRLRQDLTNIIHKKNEGKKYIYIYKDGKGRN